MAGGAAGMAAGAGGQAGSAAEAGGGMAAGDRGAAVFAWRDFKVLLGGDERYRQLLTAPKPSMTTGYFAPDAE